MGTSPSPASIFFATRPMKLILVAPLPLWMLIPTNATSGQLSIDVVHIMFYWILKRTLKAFRNISPVNLFSPQCPPLFIATVIIFISANVSMVYTLLIASDDLRSEERLSERHHASEPTQSSYVCKCRWIWSTHKWALIETAFILQTRAHFVMPGVVRASIQLASLTLV